MTTDAVWQSRIVARMPPFTKPRPFVWSGAVGVKALAEVPLRPDQRTAIEALAQAAEARHAPMAADRRDLMLAVADQVEAGNVDKSALQPRIAKVTADAAAVRDEDRAAIVKLHDLLDADQRSAFVDALETKRGSGHGLSKMKQLADDLKLTDAERGQVRSLLRGSMKDLHGEHHGKEMLEAFRQDRLDLDKVAPPKDLASIHGDRVASLAEKVLPILTADQRKLAADKVRTWPSRSAKKDRCSASSAQRGRSARRTRGSSFARARSSPRPGCSRWSSAC